MLKQLRYFQSVVRNGSFSEAAEENFISQSAISQQIQALERELGVQLLERRNRSFRLTPAGEFFYQKSLVLVADYEKMCMETVKLAKGEEAKLRIGYLRCYAGDEFWRALSEFAERFPGVEVEVMYGNHEELYEMLVKETADLVVNDQRRKFSEVYENVILAACKSEVVVLGGSVLARMERISPEELKNVPCILVSSKEQRETEREYYYNIVGFRGEFLYAENLEEAYLMVLGNRGFLPVEGNGNAVRPGNGVSLARIPLMRGNEPVLRNYCAFWKRDNSGFYVEEFAEILKKCFSGDFFITKE